MKEGRDGGSKDWNVMREAALSLYMEQFKYETVAIVRRALSLQHNVPVSPLQCLSNTSEQGTDTEVRLVEISISLERNDKRPAENDYNFLFVPLFCRATI